MSEQASLVSLPRQTGRASSRKRTGRLLANVALGLVLVFVLFPIVWLVQMSLRPDEDILGYQLLFTPTLAHYASLNESKFLHSFLNSVVASCLSTAVALIVGTPAAYVLSRWRFRARRRIAMWVLSTRMAPQITFTIPFFLFFRLVGLSDTVWGLALIYLTFNLALVIWMMRSFFDAVPRALEEAAWLDGCGVWNAFLRITLPLTAPGLAAVAVLCFIFSWNDFFYALILTRTNAMTAPVAIINFMQYEGWEWGKMAAGGTVVMLPVVIFTVLVRKWLVSGLIAGSVKD
ncbi:MAG TPA: carbohydrate ABC transporter permease [Steroidobacteraceae bacterium]|jgi:multiple sugar transport system permease protein